MIGCCNCCGPSTCFAMRIAKHCHAKGLHSLQRKPVTQRGRVRSHACCSQPLLLSPWAGIAVSHCKHRHTVLGRSGGF